MTRAVVVLAAGQGTRMNSKRQKILHEVGGKEMVQHAFEAATAVGDLPPVMVVGPGEDGVRQLFGERAVYAVQPEQLGTGHATMMAAALLRDRADQVIVTYGDMPLLRGETLQQLAESQGSSRAAVAILSVMGDPASSFGRVVRDGDGEVVEILEVAEARRRHDTERLLAIRELNAGVYCFDAPWLWAHIDLLPVRQARSGKEYYLTDMIEVAVAQGRRVNATMVVDADECLGAGTRAELADVEAAFRRRAVRRLWDAGVTIIDPESTYVDPDVIVGQDTVIWPGTFLQGQTVIGEDCIIGPHTVVRNAQIGDNCHLPQAVIENVTLETGATVVPFTVRRA